MKNYEFEIGDRVKVNAHPSGDNSNYNFGPGFATTWEENMDNAVGNTYTIEGCSEHGVLFSGVSDHLRYFYPPAALELVKENEQMIKETQLQVGDTVWCFLNGKGKVVDIDHYADYPVQVYFGNGKLENYNYDGKLYTFHVNRSLYFSEPKIEGETARPFQPKLVGKHVVVITTQGRCVGEIIQENVVSIRFDDDQIVQKSYIMSIRELGPEIKL